MEDARQCASCRGFHRDCLRSILWASVAAGAGVAVAVSGTVAAFSVPRLWRRKPGADAGASGEVAVNEIYLGVDATLSHTADYLKGSLANQLQIRALPCADRSRWDLQVTLRNGRQLEMRLAPNVMYRVQPTECLDARYSYPFVLTCIVREGGRRHVRNTTSAFAQTVIDAAVCPVMQIDADGYIVWMYRPGFTPRKFSQGCVRPRPEYRRDWEFLIPGDGGLAAAQ